FLSLLSTPIALLLPLPLQVVVDCVIGSGPLPRLLTAILPPRLTGSPESLLGVAAGLLVAVTLLQQLEGFTSWLLQLYTGEQLVLRFRAHLFRHVQRLSLLYHDTAGVSESLYRIQNDAPAMQYVIVNGVVPFVTAVLTLASMLYVTARIDWRLATLAILVLPVLLLLTETYRRGVRARWTRVKESESGALSVIQEVLASIRVVKAFGQEDRERDRFVRGARHALAEQLAVVGAETRFGLLVALVLAVGTAAVLVVGARDVRSGTLTLGSLLLVMAYLAQLYRPLETISKKVAGLQSSLASAARAFSLLDEVPDVAERPQARPLARAAGRMTLRHVSFRERRSASRGRRARARRRCSCCSPGSSIRATARSCSMASICGRTASPTSATRSPSSCRSRCSSRLRSPRTSRMDAREQAASRSSTRLRLPTWTIS
ncbi:MAG: hypothetical protein DME10_27775, partial [Candidatus Rokuibacteriota bacterium]